MKNNFNTTECGTCGKLYKSRTSHECSADDLIQAAKALDDCGQPSSEMWLDAIQKLSEEQPINRDANGIIVW